MWVLNVNTGSGCDLLDKTFEKYSEIPQLIKKERESERQYPRGTFKEKPIILCLLCKTKLSFL